MRRSPEPQSPAHWMGSSLGADTRRRNLAAKTTLMRSTSSPCTRPHSCACYRSTSPLAAIQHSTAISRRMRPYRSCAYISGTDLRRRVPPSVAARLHPSPSLGVLNPPPPVATCRRSCPERKRGRVAGVRGERPVPCGPLDLEVRARSASRRYIRSVGSGNQSVTIPSSYQTLERGLGTGPTRDIPVDDCNQTHPHRIGV